MTVAQPNPLEDVTLDDVYSLIQGRVYSTGIQALVRLLIEQRRRDEAAGLNTAGFVSGYRGSPLGGLDQALWRARAHLERHGIRFRPGINEETAATAVIGTQLVHLAPDAQYDGVFGMWYGKGPGLDRAGDALKHANALGSAPHGGVLVVVGDDHGAVSSSLAHQSEQAMIAWLMPILHPASVQDYLEFGLKGYAMSRACGVWVGFKALSETVESAATITIDPEIPRIVMPEDLVVPPQGLHIISPEPQLAAEERLHKYRLPAVAAFARANPFDRVTLANAGARYGIVAVGKAYLDLVQAMDDLGLDETGARALGLRIYKVGMPWPLEVTGARAFAEGLEEILVIEEKRGVVESQLKDLFYGLPDSARPRIFGKTDETGAELFPTNGEINSGRVARVLAARFLKDAAGPEVAEYLEFLAAKERAAAVPPVAMRMPFFCSGCPHNVSTKLPEGSRALAGTGCHLMAAFMDRETTVFLHMGAEGAAWVGQQPFVKSDHIFQNLGDGTYVHSGILAIRQALAAGVNITYKILFNDAVAMTGGQAVDGGLTVPDLTRQLYDEGIRSIAVVSDEPGKYPPGTNFAPGVTRHHRRELDFLQRRFRELPGVTAIVYDQTCAAEQRRRRKRGESPDPAKRVFINAAVCEGCGDCNEKSNCLSVEPLETEFGRKRVINQSTCNKDYSCVEGFCPSFVTVHGGTLRRAVPPDVDIETLADALPAPALPEIARPYGILIAGIGGTGVVTVGQILGMAAHLDGRGATTLDFTGLAQKGGGVLTHVRLARDPSSTHPARVPVGGADVLLAGDTVVAVGGEALATLRHGKSRAVVNAKAIPTAANVLNPDAMMDVAGEIAVLRQAMGDDAIDLLDATDAAERLIGNSIAANILLLGLAWQRGLIPLSLAAILRAIELNAVSVTANRQAFAWGRLAAGDRDAFARYTGALPDPESVPVVSLDEVIGRRVEDLTNYQEDLTNYQNAAYAARYRALVDKVRAADAALDRGQALTDAVARNFFKLMAYKDEYEVARLYTDGRFEAELKARFDGDFKLKFHLAPPLLAPRDKVTGHLRKKTFGPGMLRAMKGLARLRALRGTAFDPFGYTAERRAERRLIADYEAMIDEILPTLGLDNYDRAVELARLPEHIRGFGHIKERAIEVADHRRAELLGAYHDGARQSPLAAE